MPFKMFILRERLRLLEKYRCQSCRSRKKAAQECKSDVCSAAGSGSSTNPRTTSIFGATTECARVAKLADAPNLGLRNHRFQSVAFHFKANAFYEGKTGFSCEIVAVAMVSRMCLVLAQILAHGRARLRIMRVSTFRLLPTKMPQSHTV